MIWYPPILSYHRVDPALGEDSPTVSPDTFRKQMALLRRYFRPIALSEMLAWLSAQRPLPPLAVAVTFDDGTKDNFTHAMPILLECRIPATIFMISANLDKPGSLSGSDIRQMHERGITFGSHTAHHAYLPSLGPDEVARELSESKRALEALGLTIDYLSYPAGGFTGEIEGMARAAGYRAAFTTNRGFRRHPIDRWAIRRITVHGGAPGLGVLLKGCGYYEINHRLRAPF